ncbi:MAG: beta-ketoacyl synthase N-terminal-like domain-containing protein, partial [Planctomycetota bacterium]
MPDSQNVITGLGIVSPIGIGRTPFWDALLGGRTGIHWLAERTDGGAAPSADVGGHGEWIGATVREFEGKDYVRPRKALKVMCREIQLAFAASQLMIDDGGLAGLLPNGSQPDSAENEPQ